MILPNKIIDAHVHLDVKRHGTVDKAAKALISGIRQLDIQKVVVLALDEVNLSSEEVGRIAQGYDEFIPILSVHPYADNAIDRLKELLKKYEFKGLKLHPRLQCFDILDDRVIKLIKKTSEHNLPIIIDALPYYPKYYPEISPEIFNKLSILIPEAKIVLAHFCGYNIFDALFVAKANKNIYLDMSFSMLYFRGSSVVQDIMFAINNLNGQKILYGSDYPSYSLKEYLEYSLVEFKKTGMSQDILDKILYKNAMKLFLS